MYWIIDFTPASQISGHLLVTVLNSWGTAAKNNCGALWLTVKLRLQSYLTYLLSYLQHIRSIGI